MSKDMDQILELAKEGDLDALIERGAFRQKIKDEYVQGRVRPSR